MFEKNIYSNMHFRSQVESDGLSFDWLDEIEIVCPYIDNLIRKPKLSLIKESDIVKVEKAKKVTVDTVKNLSRHTEYIDKLDPVTDEIQPSKLLITRGEETYNTYENRFAYTLLDKLTRFVDKKERELDDIKEKKDKILEYAASTVNCEEKVVMEMKVSTQKLFDDDEQSDFEEELDKIRERLKRVGQYITSWHRSEFFTSLEKGRATFVSNPIKKTNLILKNPNFQMAMKLWDLLRKWDEEEEANQGEGNESTGDENLKGILGDSFLTDYFVLDSISDTKKEQKEKLAQYAILMIKQQLKRIISILASAGVDISDEEIMKLVAEEIRKEKERKKLDSSDIKKKFQYAMEEYLKEKEDCL